MRSIGTPPEQRPLAGHLLSGVLGGLVVLALGAVLIATGVIDTGDTKREVIREAPIAQPALASKQRGRSVADIYRDVGPGVVRVEARGGTNQSPFGLPGEGSTATGSGFVIDKDGYILTNDHVVEGSNDVTVLFSENGDPVQADVKGRDPGSDLALLKVDPGKATLDPVPLGNSSKVRVGDPVVAIGNPFGLQRTVTTGIVSAVQRRIDAPNDFTINGAIQTDASINPGNSGGPLLDANGRVIGVNSQIATGGGRGSVGIGFAVPINLAKKVVPQLKSKGRVEHPFIGVSTTRVTKQLADDLNLPVHEGALVVDIARGSPADKAGLRAGRTETANGLRVGGDLIVEANGRKIHSPDDLPAAIQDKKPGDRIEIAYYRGGDRKTSKLTLANRPANPRFRRAPEGGGGGDLFPFPFP
jgi:S1-C subfamily serine protease